MAERIVIPEMPQEYEVASSGDWHLGAKAHSAKALDILIDWLQSGPNRYLGFNGDAVEGKPAGSKHFDATSLVDGGITIEQQIDLVVAKLTPVANRILWWGYGNHDIYLLRDFDVVKVLCERLRIENHRGSYQTWIDMGGLRAFVFHGRRSMPRGAKDPIQRDANQRAWLVNELAPLAGDRHVMFMGHVHALLVQPPVEQYQLLDGPDGIRARYFIQGESQVVTRDAVGTSDTRVMVPQQSRWYGCTGTLRRSGGFGYIDYAEVAGYPPAPIGWLKMRVEGDKCVSLEKVVV